MMTMLSRICLMGLLAIVHQHSIAQNPVFAREIIDSLCAPGYHGRGYVQDGYDKAASFIIRQVEAAGLAEQIETTTFTMGVNTFPGNMILQVGDQVLTPGVDYLVDPASRALSGTFDVVVFNPKWTKSREKMFSMIASGKFTGKVVVMPMDEKTESYQSLLPQLIQNPLQAAGYIVFSNQKLTWSVGRREATCALFTVDAKWSKLKMKRVFIDLEQHFISDYKGKNVVVTLPGTDATKKKILVFTAHLDHLGRMGRETYIAGANDNASGSAMLLDLMRHYAANRPEYAVKFIWFGGEEAGLMGSQAFVSDPPFELTDIGFLINLDLMGDAGTGITVVNGKIFENAFAILSSLNSELALLSEVKARGAAANSDHHPFYEKGVPSFFIYTTGQYKHYHDVFDVPANLPLTNYSNVFVLIAQFGDEIMKKP